MELVSRARLGITLLVGCRCRIGIRLSGGSFRTDEGSDRLHGKISDRGEPTDYHRSRKKTRNEDAKEDDPDNAA